MVGLAGATIAEGGKLMLLWGSKLVDGITARAGGRPKIAGLGFAMILYKVAHRRFVDMDNFAGGCKHVIDLPQHTPQCSLAPC